MSVLFSLDSKIISKNICSLYKDNLFFDCALVSQGKQIKAHRVVLSAASNYLKKIFAFNYGQPGENIKPILIFESISVKSLIFFMRFIYDGEVAVGESDVSKFIDTLKFFEVQQYNTKTMKVTTELTPESSTNGTISPILESQESSSGVDKRNSVTSTSKNSTHDDSTRECFNANTCTARSQIKMENPSEGSSEEKTLKKVKIKDVKKAQRRPRQRRKGCKCRFCDKIYANENSLNSHQKNCKLNPTYTKSICPHCFGSFCRKDSLKIHISRAHQKS